MALIGLVYMRFPGSALQLAKIFAFVILPVFLIGPVAGVYVDRWDRRRTLFVCDFLRTCFVLLILLALFLQKPLIFIYVLIFLVFTVGRFFIPARLSIVPELVEKDKLLLANSLVSTAAMIAATFGFGIGGMLVEWLGPQGGFAINAAGFFLSGALIFSISHRKVPALKFRQLGKEIVEVIRKSVMQEIKDGISYFMGQRDVKFTGAIMFFLGGVLGAAYVMMIVFIQQTLQSGTRDIGLLIMFLGIGLFLGSLAYGRFGRATTHFIKVISFSLVVCGVFLTVFVLGLLHYPYFFFAACLAFISGACVSPVIISCNTLIHNSSQNGMMGRVFTSLEILMHFSFLLFMFLSSFLAEFIQPQTILLVLSVSLILVGALNLVFRRKIPWLN